MQKSTLVLVHCLQLEQIGFNPGCVVAISSAAHTATCPDDYGRKLFHLPSHWENFSCKQQLAVHQQIATTTTD